MPPFLSENSTLRAGLYMVLAMGSFVVNDTCIKLIGTALPIGELVAVRGALAACFIAVICASQGVLTQAPAMFSRIVSARALLDLVGTLFFIAALMHMEIANLTAILQAVPLAVAVFSVVFLKERIGWRRSLAIAVGFIGVLFIVKPAPQTFSIYEAMALSIVFSLAIRDIITRRIPARVPTLIIALANALFVTAGGLLLALVEDFIWPEPWQFGLLVISAFFLGLGYMFMVATLRIGDLSATAPYRYTIVLFAIISGVVVFGEFPDRYAYLGMALIVAAGIYAAHREAKLRNISRMRSP